MDLGVNPNKNPNPHPWVFVSPGYEQISEAKNDTKNLNQELIKKDYENQNLKQQVGSLQRKLAKLVKTPINKIYYSETL